MPKPEEDLIDKLTLRPEVKEKTRALLRLAHSKTGPGTGYDIGEAKVGLPAICAYIASKSAGYADITEEVAQKASCLAPKTFASTLRTVKTALLASNTPTASPSKSAGNRTDPTAYATLICEHKIGQPLRVESWMKEAQAALTALPRFRNDFASRLSESGPEVRTAVFFWVCRAIKLSTVQSAPLAEKYGVSSKTLSRLVKAMDDECVDLKESIRTTIKEMRLKKAADTTESATAAAAASSSKTPTSTPSRSQPDSRSASPTKSALRDTSKPPPSRASVSPTKRKVAFSLSDASASSENDDVFAPETPSKRPRTAATAATTTTTTPRRVTTVGAATPTRVLPVRKAASSRCSISSGEDVEMLDAPAPPAAPLVPLTPRRLVASEPVAGPSTPRRRSALATPTHAYRTPPSARIRMLSLLSGDEEDGDVDEEAEAAAAEEEEGGDDDDDDGGALPLSRRFRPVFLDRAQWAQRAPRLARDRAAAERRMKELIERWGHPFAFLRT